MLDISITSPTGLGMTAMRVCATGVACAEIDFEVIAADQTEVYHVNPRQGVAAGVPQKVSLYVRNFPKTSAGGSPVVQEELRVKIDEVSFTVQNWIKSAAATDGTTTGGLDVFELNVPGQGQALALNGQAYRDLEGLVYIEGEIRLSKIGSFTYRIVRADASAIPVDGSTTGGLPITLRLHWGLQISMSSLTVMFGQVPAIVTGVENFNGQNVFHTDVSVISPVMTATGMILVTVSGQDISESIAFEVYRSPTISMVLPNKASLDGQTGECTECLVHDKNSVSLWIQNFPMVSSASELLVVIGSVVCDGLACSVLSLQNLADHMYLAVSVPARSTAGSVVITVSVIGKGPAPDGMSLRDDYVRTQRIATHRPGAFAYVLLNADIVSVFYCLSCVLDPAASCVSSAVCADGDPAIVGSETDTVIPTRGGGVLALVIANTGTILPSAKPLVTIGTSSTNAIVRSSTPTLTVLELQVPATTLTGKQLGTVEISPSSVLSFSALVYDDQIQMTCVSSTAPYSTTPCVSTGATTVTVQLSSFNVGRPQDVYKAISAYFGVLAAKEITWKCCADGSKVILSVAVPAHSAPQLATSFSNGRADLDFKIVLVSDPMIFAVTRLTIWAPPRITSVRFESDGTSLLLTFDQPTNTVTLSKGAGSCGSIVSAARSLGAGAMCLWQADHVLRVNLGSSADIAVDDMIGVSSNSNVRSSNDVSFAMVAATSSVKVGKPLALLVPGPTKIIAPSSVDPCGPVEMSFVVPSPRSLDYFWSCENDDKLDTILRTHNSAQIAMGEGTDELQHSDFTYVIRVYATDFLGVNTPTQTFELLKTGSAAPALSIVGKAQYLTMQDVVIMGSATFSQCFGRPKGNLLYSWDLTGGGNQVIGTALELDQDQRTKPQLYFAPMDLAGGRSYRTVLTVTNQADISQISSASFDLVMTSPTLVAMISGGASISVSQHAKLVLDALASHDPEMGRTAPDPALLFSWTCVLRVGDHDQPCLNKYKDQVSSLEKVLVLPTTGSISLTSFTLAVTSEKSSYVFSVSVRKGNRISSSSTHVTVLAEDFPTAAISSTSFTVFDKLTGLPKINADARLNLEMMLSIQSTDLSYRWTVISEVGESSLQQLDAVPMNFNQDTFVLLPPPDVFLPSFTYTITLMVTKSGSSSSGFNTLSLIINKPPSSGICEACNLNAASAGSSCITSGVALQDAFRISCRHWADEDLPLSYIFGFEVSGGDVTTASPKATPFSQQLLPVGATALTAQVVDSMHATSPVQRLAVSVSTGRRLLSWETSMTNALAEAQTALGQGDATQVNSLAQVIAASLESSANTYSVADRRSVRGTLEQHIDAAWESAAPTVASAVEALGAGAKVGSIGLH